MADRLPETMAAVVQHRYGPVEELSVSETAVPLIGAGDVLVRVHAAGVDAGTWHLTTGRPLLMRVIGFGMRGPTSAVRGLAFAGRVVAVGSAVRRYSPGDDVFGSAPGAFAEYLRVAEGELAALPTGLGYEQAAAVPISGVTALQAVRAADVTAGRRVLVIGAAGGVGTFAVQLAVGLGATVTGVCSGGKAALVRELGAERVIDYTDTDVTALPERWDAIIDTAGNRPLARLRKVLAPAGSLVIVGGEANGSPLGGMGRVLGAALADPFTRQRLRGLVSRENAADLAELGRLVEAGVVHPVIDTVYPLAAVAEAVRHVGDGRARGKVVLAL
ncbi:NAD(P)-dependent alcohol dehydrogenase [Leifsonia poae]|uniref:NAD(P)-dependent alcohol dehydrogenase n=1 Tax=Leifsonia poae TaxID=110933 RepID=UPI001CBBC889|nr:NAD(P)-dependent alcohol dehydrogenase [Leifsonia poae]